MKDLISNNPQFIKLWASQALSQVTVNLVNFLVLIRIFEATKSSVAVSLLWVAYSLPALVLAPFSGPIVDYFSKRKLMIITNFLQALTISMLLISTHHYFTMYVIVFLYSLLDQLYVPSQQASLPWLVKKDQLTSANSVFTLTQQASFLVGFGLGGVFLSLIGRSTTIVLSTLFLLMATISVYLLPKDNPKQTKSNKSLADFIEDFKIGFDYMRSRPSIALPVVTIILAQIVITIISIILPSYTRTALEISLNSASLVLILPGAIGALGFTYLLPGFQRGRRKIKIIELGLLVSSLSLFALAVIPYVGDFKVILAIIIAIGFGVSLGAITIPSHTLLQEKTPPAFLGRVYSSLNFFLIVATSLPLLLAATVADLFGVTTLILLFALLTGIGYLFTRRKGDYVLANGFRF